MKVLALNSSARSEGESKTKLMLNHLVNGMLGAGADVDVVNLAGKEIKKLCGMLYMYD
ncbi:MAG: NAD(P)H-dependent oxidoreductase [Spirochaetota bacterium]|nr:NAD(P)H-dependent oxidoreductase [Spirochaetota bacterium]